MNWTESTRVNVNIKSGAAERGVRMKRQCQCDEQSREEEANSNYVKILLHKDTSEGA